jgi:hypothetical protein
VSSEGEGLYSGRLKLALCGRLSGDWAALADYFEIPEPTRRGFDRGREPHEVWEWLSRRGRLGELRAGLDYIGRADLVELLGPDPLNRPADAGPVGSGPSDDARPEAGATGNDLAQARERYRKSAAPPSIATTPSAGASAVWRNDLSVVPPDLSDGLAPGMEEPTRPGSKADGNDSPGDVELLTARSKGALTVHGPAIPAPAGAWATLRGRLDNWAHGGSFRVALIVGVPALSLAMIWLARDRLLEGLAGEGGGAAVKDEQEAGGKQTSGPSIGPVVAERRVGLPGDEGMWTFDNLPLVQLKSKYGFEPSKAWVEHLRSSAVRFNNGGSGSFVSADGLVMTNHHVGEDTLQKISTKEKDYYKDGFHARSYAEEVKAPNLELSVLVGINDVTDRVNAKVTPDMDDPAAGSARRQAMATIEKEWQGKTGLRSEVITLYQGGKYHLYTFKRYYDVRLVFAPEFEIAFFGGDPDNFAYPRYALDVCFFRAYEDGKPAKVEQFLKLSLAGSKEGDLVFVAGHPGRTSRLDTLAHLEYLRDVQFPFALEFLRNREAHRIAYGQKGPEQRRQAEEDLVSFQNSLKARLGALAGLQNQAFMQRKARQEQGLRDEIQADPMRRDRYAVAWDKIAESTKVAARLLKADSFLERGFAFDSELFQIARTLVRLAEENPKPNAERLREYGDAGRASLEQRLYSSSAPIYPEYETAKLANSLAYWKQVMGADDPIVQRVLRGRDAQEVASTLVEGSKLSDVEVRKKLATGGSQSIAMSDDTMIKLALAIDADARAVRKEREDEVERVQTSQYALIAKARFEIWGTSTYPDPIFTLRLAFGTIQGYEVNGKTMAAYTTLSGAFTHAAEHRNQPPYELPSSWQRARAEGRLKLATPLNFVSTPDIIGGNSGSPVVNRDNEVVGLIFDGNMQSLVLDYGYDDSQARAISVDSRAIIEALRAVYKAERLVNELVGR